MDMTSSRSEHFAQAGTSRLILALPSWQISPEAARSKPSTSITKYAQQGQGFLDPPSFSDSGSLKLRLYTLGKQ